MHDGKDDVRNSAAIGMQGSDRRSAFVAKDAIESVDGLADCTGNDSLVERSVAVRDRGIDLDVWISTKRDSRLIGSKLLKSIGN